MLSFKGGRNEIKSRFRSAISPWIDRRQKLDIIRDELEERGIALLRQSELNVVIGVCPLDSRLTGYLEYQSIRARRDILQAARKRVFHSISQFVLRTAAETGSWPLRPVSDLQRERCATNRKSDGSPP